MMMNWDAVQKKLRAKAPILPLVVLLLSGWAAQGTASLGPFLITMEAWSPYYQPFTATVQPGKPIQWINPTASPHTIRHDSCLTPGACAFDSGAVLPDESYTISGLPPGRYPYHCELHPIMRGELIVGEQTFPVVSRRLGR